ncbi:MAG: LysM peptidoglycan-binding domain-containing protein [Acidobacteriaceae bacterium]|nr:LysM peptidoglycan-binding domain-containing protein [Acidobacteriaceae bacterium]MBV9778555.1 LysM peptidoglycan-binding domain-containing protein [Acidobacteriaceae bacterium]
MEFQYASISPEGGQSFSVLFNPTNYTVEKANQIAEAAIPGLKAPILQYVHGNSRTLSMELFFDTYEEQEDVSAYTDQVYNLLLIDPSTHVPPICDVSWGSFSFRGVLDHVSGRFTLFQPDGTPARATLSVTFKEYIDVTISIQQRPKQSSDHRKTRVVQAGDRLSDIAYQEYGDARKWRPIADVNRLDNPLTLTPGQRLIIPALNSSGEVKHA